MRGHFEGDPCSEAANLLMDVHEECLGFPSSLFLNGGAGDAIQMHCHGTTRLKGMGSNIFGCVAILSSKKADAFGTFSHSVADVVVADGFVHIGLVIISCNGTLSSSTIADDVVDAMGQGLDGAVGRVGACVVDALAFDSILLVPDAEGGLCGCEQFLQRCRVGNDVVAASEGDVFQPERDGPRSQVCTCCSVFPHSQQIVKGNVDQVCYRCLPCWTLGSPEGLFDQIFGEAHGDCQLGTLFRVPEIHAPQLFFEAFEVFFCAKRLFGGILFSSHTEFRGDGSKRFFN